MKISGDYHHYEIITTSYSAFRAVDMADAETGG
jgi:hypothetical protein